MLIREESIASTEKTLHFIRCFEECVNSFVNNKPLPLALCYQRSRTKLRFEKNSSLAENNVYLFNEPIDDLDSYYSMLNNFEYLNSDHVIDRQIIDYLVTSNCTKVNTLGRWILITRIKKFSENSKSDSIKLNPPLWLLKHRFGDVDQFKLTESTSNRGKAFKRKEWLNYVEKSYAQIDENDKSTIVDDSSLFDPNIELMQMIRKAPSSWSLELDEELAELLKDSVNTDYPGSIRNLIKSISVSTQRTTEDTDYLISLDKRTFWESDSYASTYNGYNSIRLFLKPDIKINRLYIVISKESRQHQPKDVAVYGGKSSDDADELNKITIKQNEDGDILLLENCIKSYDYIEIRIKSCQSNLLNNKKFSRNGTNCRVYGVKIFTQTNVGELFSSEMFLPDKLLQNNPRLTNYRPTFLFRRSELLLRFVKLFDHIQVQLLPIWSYGSHFQQLIQNVKRLIVLSSKRIGLLEKILNSIPTTRCYMPLIYIDRPLAFAYRGKIALDPKYQNTIFMQIFNRIKKSFSFRWNKDVEQWWECKFIGEGIIDQGGGFRDSLSDISEELCPNSQHADVSVPLPFFIRSPNQIQSDSNTYKDMYVPNPSCKLFDEYEFIGKLMGACLRSKENLALYLAPLFWKKISNEHISWKLDFSTVDAAEVKLLDSIEKMTEPEFERKYANEKTWSCILSDGSLHELIPNGSQVPLVYADRLKYSEMVKQVRLAESDKQIDAIKRGLQSVLSKHIFSILIWSEFEFKICGAPKISVEDLKMSVEYEDELSFQDNRVQYFWEALTNFTNDERSKFVRFVTGRKRLPVKIYFCSSDQPSTSFPDSSTCNCSLYFPNYPSAQVAEEKLRYAIHNCVAIDTDCSSFDD